MSIPMSAPSLQADEPCDPFMAGLTFHHAPISGKDAADVHEYVKAMQRAGAVVTPHHDAHVTHVVLSKTGPAGSEDEALYKAAGRAGSRVVSWFWIQECLKARELVPVDDSVLFRPLPSLEGLPEMRGLKICVTGYTGDRRAELITIVGLLGAEYMRALDRRSTHLVCFEFEGAKWAKANQTKIQKIVSHRWLEACLGKWTRLPEAPYATLSGKEEDELAAAAAEDPEVPDSDDEGALVEDSLATEPADPGGGSAAKRARALGARAPEGSLGTFVTELTAGDVVVGARGVAGADDDVAPGTMLRDVSSAQEAAAREEGEKEMQPPAPRAPRSASQPRVESRGAAALAAPGSELPSPDWGALEQRASQHIERSRRDVELDPTLSTLRGRGEPVAAAQLAFAGRVGSPDAVEAAFGGRFAHRQPARFHAFGDGDAPLAADDFSAFLKHVAAGVWEPDALGADDGGTPAWLRRVLTGETRFETFAARPALHVSGAPNSVSVVEPAPGMFMACLSSARAEDLERWSELCAESKTRSARGPLGAAVLARLRMETAKQPDGDVSPAGPDALLRAFLEVYCPFGHEMGWSSLRAMLRPAAAAAAGRESDARLRLRDAGEVVTLPRRTPGNLEGVTLCEVRRPLREVLAGFHELLAGPTEPDMTQADRPADFSALGSAPPHTKEWTANEGARMSVQACAPGSQAAVAAASAGWLANDEPAECARDDAPTRNAEPEKEDEEEARGSKREVRGDLAAQLDACAGAGAETEALAVSADEATEASDDETVVAPGRRARGANKRPVLLTQDTAEDEGADGDGNRDGDEKNSARRARVPRATRARTAKTPVSVATTPTTKTPKTPAADAKASRSKSAAARPAAARAAGSTGPRAPSPAKASKKPSNTKKLKKAARGGEASGSGPRVSSFPPAAERRPRIALSGFSSADLTKYGATATRLGASLCAGHAWDPRATHVVFGPRGSRSIKFLAAAASGVPLLDASFLDASRRAGAMLGAETFGDHLWRGGWRGADAGLVAPDASARWWSHSRRARENKEDPRPFAGLCVAVAPFPSSNRVERDMLVAVLRAGGARVSTVSAKGALIPAAPAPDVAIVDPGSFAGADAAAGRAGAAAAAAAGGACVAPEFFKSWLSRPGTSLAQHVLRGEVVGALADALARASGADAERADEREAEKPAPRPASRAKAPPRAAKPAPRSKAAEAAASKAAGSGTKRTAAKDRAAPIVSKRRRVLAPRN